MRESRLVTLTGSGGSGQTRVALAVATAAAQRFAAGARFVDLTSVGDDADDLHRIVDRALHTTDGPASIADLVGAGLLLVLDNCEHVVDAAAELADELVTRALGVVVLVTARQALGIQGDRRIAVPAPSRPRRWSRGGAVRRPGVVVEPSRRRRRSEPGRDPRHRPLPRRAPPGHRAGCSPAVRRCELA